MYNNLRAEMVRRGLTNRDLASLIDMPYVTFCNKLKGKTDFTLPESKKIIIALGEDVNGEVFTVEHLFY